MFNCIIHLFPVLSTLLLLMHPHQCYNLRCEFYLKLLNQSDKGDDHMNKLSGYIATLLAASLLCGCASVNVNINTKSDEVPEETEVAADNADTALADDSAADDTADLANFPQLTSEDYDLSRYDDDKNLYFECKGNFWTLTDDSAKQYPKLAEAVKKVENDQKDYFVESMNEYDSDAKEFAEEQRKENYDGTYSATSDMGINCADPKYVSLVATVFTYFGGAHPDTVTVAYNIDVATGQFVPLSAVISDKEGLDKILKDALMKDYGDHDFFDLDDSLKSLKMALPAFETEDPTYNFAFNPNGLTFYFDPAELSPYAFSGEQVDLTYDDLASVLDENFSPTPEN